MFDTHAVARSLTEADFTPAQADAITNAVRLAAEQGDTVTSDQFKAGLAEVRSEIAEVRTEIASLDTRFSTQIAEARAEQRTQIAEVRTEIASLDTRRRSQRRAPSSGPRSPIGPRSPASRPGSSAGRSGP